MPTDADQLTDLLARCALGDRRSFEALYRATSAQLFGVILRIVNNQDIAAEILQESYVKIWHKAGDFRADIAKPLTWMGTIARNQAIDTVRRASYAANHEPIEDFHWLADESEQADPVDQAHQARCNQSLMDCLNQLEGAQKEALLMAYFGGLTHEELAQKLDRPLGTVKSWLRRGLQRLKDCLDKL